MLDKIKEQCNKKINSEKIDVPIYYINMDKDTGRKTFMEKQLDSLSSVTRIPGIVLKDQKQYNITGTFSKMSSEEIGCTLAHLNAAKQLLEDDLDFALVCEDDASFSLSNIWRHSLSRVGEELTKLNKYWTTCHLFHWLKNKSNRYYEVLPLEYNICSWGAVAYLISKKGAQALSNITTSFTEFDKSELSTSINNLINIENLPADDLLYNLKNSRGYMIQPSIIFPNNADFESSLHTKHTNIHVQRCHDIIEENLFFEKIKNDADQKPIEYKYAYDYV